MTGIPRSLCALALTICSCASTLEAEEIRPLEIGADAPDFDLPGVDGKRYTLKSFSKSQALAVLFTCNHCPTAQAYEARIKKLVEDYRGKSFALVAISPNDPLAVRLDELGYTDVGDSLDDMKIRARDAKFNFPYLYDGETQDVSRKYGPRATPHVFLFDSGRKLRYTGRIDDDESGKKIKRRDLRLAIDAVLARRPVEKPQTRSFGCSTKWSDKRRANELFLEKLAKEKVTLADIDVAGAKKLRANATKKLLVVNFWATWCGPCVIEFPDLVTAHHMYRHRDVELVTISFDAPERREKVLEFLKKKHASSRNFIFTGTDRDAFADALEPAWSGALPLTVIVAPGGKVLWRHEGQVDALELRRKIVGRIGRTYH